MYSTRENVCACACASDGWGIPCHYGFVSVLVLSLSYLLCAHFISSNTTVDAVCCCTLRHPPMHHNHHTHGQTMMMRSMEAALAADDGPNKKCASFKAGAFPS